MTGIPRLLLTILLFLCIPLLGTADYATGPDFEFSLLYLVPVIVLAWREDGRVAIGAAVLAAACALTADTALHGVTIFTLWNGFTRLAIYVALAVLGSLVHSNRERLATMNVRLARLLEEEQRLARTDTLTGLANSRAFSDALHRAIARNRRDRTPLAVACFDLDNFKSLNDAQGHAGGDRALLAAAGALTRVARSADLAARIGGDEFAVLLHNCNEAGAHAVAGRMLQELTSVMQRAGTGLGASVGVACFTDPPDDPDVTLGAADRALYEAKSQGKGRMVIVSVPAHSSARAH
ncbi:MAG TPA: GGDEF domain-containing protein [Vicinamibacterales bacterium]|nr:GGDEF domain-containing protein [Vicinamibacterales bacterium]